MVVGCQGMKKLYWGGIPYGAEGDLLPSALIYTQENY